MPRVGNVAIARQLVALDLIEGVATVRIVLGARRVDVRFLVETLERALVGGRHDLRRAVRRSHDLVLLRVIVLGEEKRVNVD